MKVVKSMAINESYSMIDCKKIYNEVSLILKNALVENYINESFELMFKFLNVTKNDVLLSKPIVCDERYNMLIEMTKKRSKGYPLQYILGEWEFYGLPFIVGEGVLIPRSDTETLVNCVVEYAKKRENKNLKIVDLCSGSGCIAITLKNLLPECDIYAIEKSDKALYYLHKNVELNNKLINVLKDDVLNPKTDLSDFDVIVSNPPYLTKEDMDNLQLEVSYEPDMALYGEDDGLYFYRVIPKIWTNRLNKNGLLAFEIGQNQHDDVGKILLENGYNSICKKRDLCDIIRVVSGKL